MANHDVVYVPAENSLKPPVILGIVLASSVAAIASIVGGYYMLYQVVQYLGAY